MIASPRAPRSGLSLLEVLTALVIFMLAFVAISELLTSSARYAVEIQQREHASQLCQSKLAEIVAGAVPLTGQNDVAFPEDGNWTWSLDCTQGEVPGLWNVIVRVSRPQPEGGQIECVLSQMVLDPSLRGSTMDAVMAATGTDTPEQSGTGTSGTGGTSGTQTPTTGGR